MSDKPLRNFDKFEVGHYYVYTGEKREGGWSPFGQMDFVLDHKIHKCFGVLEIKPIYAEFENVEGGIRDWTDGFDNWVEVESPEAGFETNDDCLKYDKMYKTWKIHKVHESYFNKANNKNGYDNTYDVFYICKRKHNKKEEPKENISCGTPMKMSSSSLAKEPIWQTARTLSKWLTYSVDKEKEIDKKDNVFKKYIRTKKYMKFVKEKK